MEELLANCRELHQISPETAEAYAQSADLLQNHVAEQLETNPKINELIGRNSFDMMRTKQRNHTLFMTTVFRINSFELMARSLPWVYRMYHAKGFLYDYFLVELIAWQVAIHECFANSEQKSEILAVYRWLIQHHEKMIRLSISGESLTCAVQSEADDVQQVFLPLLLHGDSQGCLMLAEQSVKTADDLKHFYLHVIWPSLYRIGQLWESNIISVAEEHVATAIVGRVMAALYPRFALFEITKGTIIVSAGPNEFHEVGARMVADFLEMDGWDVTYLGANTPVDALLETLKKNNPFVVALSVATVFNLDSARQVIRTIKDDQETKDIKIMVGGLAFSGMPDLWHTIGADGYAADAESALHVTDEWWTEENKNHA
jgi:methanogenic corrinoid protein MtbC1